MKYRIWDKKWNCFSEEPTYRISINKNGDIYNSENDEWTKPGERYIIQLASGIYDINDKEIYEGDIIKIPDNYDLYGMMAGEIREIIFQYGGFRLKPSDSRDKGHWLEDNKIFEIIGYAGELGK